MVDAARVSDTLGSLTHLVRWNDGDAGLVHLYARQLEERLRGVGGVAAVRRSECAGSAGKAVQLERGVGLGGSRGAAVVSTGNLSKLLERAANARTAALT